MRLVLSLGTGSEANEQVPMGHMTGQTNRMRSFSNEEYCVFGHW